LILFQPSLLSISRDVTSGMLGPSLRVRDKNKNSTKIGVNKNSLFINRHVTRRS
jgi:hypothetical protein